MQSKRIRFIATGAAIAALYVVLTLLANAFGLANYAIQIRFSEALSVLPYFSPAAVWGLFAGCILSNILTGCLPLDVVFGSLATLIGAVFAYKLRRFQWLVPLPNIVSNTIIVPLVLAYVYRFEGSLPYFMLTVGIGEILSGGVLGLLLLRLLEPHRDVLFRTENE